jgi:hypothetical protein
MGNRVGSVFRWRRDALGFGAGTIGVCYRRLSNSHCGLLFDNGVPAVLTDIELNRYAERLGCSSELISYRFENLNQLFDDFAGGRFARAFRGITDIDEAVA